MARGSENRSVQWLPIAVAAACTTALALLLFTGVRLAARLQSASSALQLASGLTAQPQLLHSELTLIQRGLETQTYVGDSLRSLAAGRTASNHAFAHLASAMQEAGLAARLDTAALYAQARAHWQPLETGLAKLEKTRQNLTARMPALEPLLARHGIGIRRDRLADVSRKVTDALSDPRDPSGYSAHDILSLGFLSTPKLTALLQECRPDSVAIENLFFATNVRSALKLGHARGVAMLAAVEAGVQVVEYTPTEIKRAVVGYGRAEKHQVQQMVKLVLGMSVLPMPHDAADALAVAICHVHSLRPSRSGVPTALPRGKAATSWRHFRVSR